MSIKNIAFFLLMALPFTGAQAQTIAEANQAVIDACGRAGGKMTKFTAGKCDFQRCIYSDNKSDGTFYRSGDNQRSNCSEAELKTELQKIRDDLDIDLGPRSAGGSGGGSSTSGSAGGSGSGGSGAGGASGSGAGDAGAGGMTIVCDFVEGGLSLSPGSKCYKECTKKVNGVRVAVTDTEKCRKCLNKHYKSADGSPLRFKTPVRGTVNLPDVRVRTGEIQCRDLNTGKVVNVVGTTCSPGTVIVTDGSGAGTVVVGSARPSAGGGATTVVVATGGTGGGASVSTEGLPAFCLSDKKKDKQQCAEYLARQDRFRCASSSSASGCIRDIDEIRSRYSTDCYDCDVRRRSSGGGSSFAEILGAIAPIGVAGLQGYFGYKSNKAWAGAAAAGFEQCQIHNGNYLQYLSANELPGLTPEQQRMMGCNGFNLGGYAGMGGMYGGYYGAGYSPGFVGGMMGPYGMYNPYGMGGMGGMVGGAIGGMAGGGLYGGYMGGMQGGLIGGGLVGGLVQGGMIVAGMNGGYVAGMQGGYVAGMQGGYMAGGMGYPAGGMMTGLVQGGMIAAGYPAGGMAYPAGGYVAGMQGGYMTGGYVAGMQGGYMAGGLATGLVQGGMIVAGMNGGIAGGGYGCMAIGCQGGMGGWGSGVGGYGYNPYAYGAGYGYGSAYGAMSSTAASRDAMLQQQGLSYQMGMMSSGSMGASGMTMGTAGYNPYNMGYGLGMGVGVGVGGYVGF